MADSGWSVNGVPVPRDDDYTDNVTHLRLFDEGDGWVIDGADESGKYSQDLFKYDTREEALEHVEEFAEFLKSENYTLPEGEITLKEEDA
jgi:hypothetical protein